MVMTGTANSEGETMTMARERLTARLATFEDDQILEMLTMIDSEWEFAKPEHRVLRSNLLNEWEKRHGGESVDALMDSLKACIRRRSEPGAFTGPQEGGRDGSRSYVDEF